MVQVEHSLFKQDLMQAQTWRLSGGALPSQVSEGPERLTVPAGVPTTRVPKDLSPQARAYVSERMRML